MMLWIRRRSKIWVMFNNKRDKYTFRRKLYRIKHEEIRRELFMSSLQIRRN